MHSLATVSAIAPKEQLNEWHNLWFSEHKKAGYVAVTDFQRQYFYGSNDIQKVIKATAGRRKQFISINAFDVDFNAKTFSREAVKLKQLRNIAIDIDQYKLGMTVDEVIDEIQVMILENKIPEPNLVLESRGVQLFYSIDRGAPSELAWLTSYITEQFVAKMEHLGADSNAKDVSRVMRVPNSVNERNNVVVKPYIWNSEAYTLQELQSYCRPLEKFTTRKKTRATITYLPTSVRLLQFYKTNYARLSDLNRLVDLRNGDFTGVRNVFLYMYAYHESLVLDTQQDVLKSVRNMFADVYSKKDKPLSNREFERTVKSAYKDAEAFFNHYKDNGYTIVYKHLDGIKKPYKTKNMIKKLSITLEEQENMRTLRNPEIAKKQHAAYMRNKRRGEGSKTRDEYVQSKRDEKAERVVKLAGLLERYPSATQRELADMMDVSAMTISRLIKVIDK